MEEGEEVEGEEEEEEETSKQMSFMGSTTKYEEFKVSIYSKYSRIENK